MQLPFDAYLDIETTGLCSFYDEITVIGICLVNGSENRLVQLVGSDIKALGEALDVPSITKNLISISQMVEIKF